MVSRSRGRDEDGDVFFDNRAPLTELVRVMGAAPTCTA
jgi:hypothetical protein